MWMILLPIWRRLSPTSKRKGLLGRWLRQTGFPLGSSTFMCTPGAGIPSFLPAPKNPLCACAPGCPCVVFLLAASDGIFAWVEHVYVHSRHGNLVFLASGQKQIFRHVDILLWGSEKIPLAHPDRKRLWKTRQMPGLSSTTFFSSSLFSVKSSACSPCSGGFFLGRPGRQNPPQSGVPPWRRARCGWCRP